MRRGGGGKENIGNCCPFVEKDYRGVQYSSV